MFHHPQNESFGDQFFSLIHGTGKHAGYYALQAKLAKKVLFLRNAEPRVGHVDGNGMYDDNWFKLELGTGKHASNFHLRCDQCSDIVIFFSHRHGTTSGATSGLARSSMTSTFISYSRTRRLTGSFTTSMKARFSRPLPSPSPRRPCTISLTTSR